MRRDYDKVNGILERVEKDIKVPLSDALIAEVDTAFGTTDDFLALWSIRHARDQAWERARIMQHIPGEELDGLFDRHRRLRRQSAARPSRLGTPAVAHPSRASAIGSRRR